jgi:hopanoid-associated phosphorylase
MSVLAVVGLAKEARIARRAGLKPVIGGGDSLLLVKRLNAAAPGATAVVSFGIAGALAPLLQTGDIVIATHVVSENDHYISDPGWSQTLRGKLVQARSVVIVGVNDVVSHMGMKKALFRTTGAHAVDMESHVAARFAHQRGLPFVALRAICDDALRSLPPAALEPLTPSGRLRLTRVLKSLLHDPSQFPELLQTGREANAAFGALRRCSDLLGPGLGCPYLG